MYHPPVVVLKYDSVAGTLAHCKFNGVELHIYHYTSLPTLQMTTIIITHSQDAQILN